MSGAKDLSETLSEVFGTKVASVEKSPEELEKEASIEFFHGLCQEQGVDLNKLSDNDVETLFKAAMDMRKEAGEVPPQFAKKDDKKPEEKGGEEDDKKKEAAAKEALAVSEFMSKKAAATKVAEADAMGRIMAHSFVSELSKIAEKDGGFPFPPKGKDEKDGKDGKDDGKKEASAADRVATLLASFQAKTASAPAAVEGGSTTPAFDEYAAHQAIDMLKQAGVDETLAYNRVNAVYTLGLKDSTKIASAADTQEGLRLRALEICEAAGFAVDWSQA